MTKELIYIEIPNTFAAERMYIIEIIFSNFLGLDHRVSAIATANSIEIIKAGKRLILSDCFFSTLKDNWLSKKSLPLKPLKSFDTDVLPFEVKLTDSSIPVIYGHPTITFDHSHMSVGIDLIGSMFFLLSRYEEYVIKDKDLYGRFPFSESICSTSNLIERPIVNEYLEILWSSMSFLWPNLTRKKYQFLVSPTHDVDRPFAYLNRSFNSLLKSSAEQILLNGGLSGAARLAYSSISSKLSNGTRDPYNTFNYIMEQSELRSLTSEFNFIVNSTDKIKDCDYSISDTSIMKLITSILERGHRIGLHGSYNSFNDQKMLMREANELRRACDNNNVKFLSGRQHYLRWDMGLTPKFLNASGINYDSTLYFAESPGFRTGCCYEYPLYNLLEHKTLQLIEKPLIFMESSVINNVYADNRDVNVHALIKNLKDVCELFSGDFVFLWHNSNLSTPELKELYEFTLDC